MAGGDFVENISFNFTVFLEFLNSRSLSEFCQILNLKSLSQSSYYSVFAHGLYLEKKEACCFLSKFKKEASDKKKNNEHFKEATD